MKRNLKNIIMIAIIIITLICWCITMKSLNNNSSNMPNMNNMEANNGGTPPTKPEGDTNSDNSDTLPTRPDGDTNSDNGGTPPTKPEGNTNSDNGDTPPEMQNANNSIETKYYIAFGIESFVISSLVIYLIISRLNGKRFNEILTGKCIIVSLILIIAFTAILTYSSGAIANKYFINNKQQTEMQDGPNGGGNSNSSIEYKATTEISSDTEVSDETYESSNSDENALLVTGNIKAELSDITVTKTGDSEGGDNSNFYGNNSGIIAKDGATLNLSNSEITTNADGANGVFSYGGSATTNNSSNDGTTVNISDSKITTTGDNAGGIMTTGGGTTNATNLTINTSGTSSATIRSDRGGGTVNVDGGTYTTTGVGSPSIYSTADITVKNSDLISEASEGIVIEGKNSVSIENCNLTDSNTKLNGQSTTYKNIFLYQSMSGDAADGVAEFDAKNSKIITNNGDSFYVTNTTATIELENNTIINNDDSGNFLRIQKDSWGNSGSNGGNVTLNLKNQEVKGNIVVDSISTLDMNIKENSYYEGSINTSNEAKEINLKLDSNSKIKLTGDSYVSTLEDEDTSYSNIDFNGYTLYVNGTAIN